MKKWPKEKDRPGIDRYGRDELINSVIDNDIEKVKFLIKNGANINSKDDNLWTPLHFAAQEFNKDIIEILLINKADPNAKDISGNTPIFRALFNCKGRDSDIFNLLMEYGGNPELKNNSGVSAIDLARQVDNYNLKKYFSSYFK